MFDRVILTCEHASNAVAESYHDLFSGHDELLKTHRGWDLGALSLGQLLATRLGVPFFPAWQTRLLIDCNRRADNPKAFSEFTKGLPEREKARIVSGYHKAYRDPVIKHIKTCTDAGLTVLHLSIHTFTPVLDGKVRTCDVGLLYDPARPAEKAFCDTLKHALVTTCPGLRIRYNYPYTGVSDGFTTALRKLLPANTYAGIEVEVNQAFPSGDAATWQSLQDEIYLAFRKSLGA